MSRANVLGHWGMWAFDQGSAHHQTRAAAPDRSARTKSRSAQGKGAVRYWGRQLPSLLVVQGPQKGLVALCPSSQIPAAFHRATPSPYSGVPVAGGPSARPPG